MKNEFKKQLQVMFDWNYDSLKQFKIVLDKSVTEGIGHGFRMVKKDIKDIFVDAFRNAITEMKNMLEFSQLSSAKTREYAFDYGFSSAEAYGFEKALNVTGLQSEEDLYYANTQELQQFRQAFEKYSTKYTELYDQGFFSAMQDFQVEMNEFKEDLTLEVVEFFMENKTEIKAAMRGLINLTETVVKLAAWLVDVFDPNQTTTTSDIVSQYRITNSNSTNATNVNISNNYNGVGRADEGWLSDVGSLSYQQFIEALGGRS